MGLGNEEYFEKVGWTLSYLPELKMWISRHSYVPNLYVNGEYDLYSVEGRGFFDTIMSLSPVSSTEPSTTSSLNT